MPLRKELTRVFDRTLYGTILETVTFLKRNDDQQQGTVRSMRLFNCRRPSYSKTGETIQGDMDVKVMVRWQIPSRELRKNGVQYINNLDRIVDKQNRYWQPEAGEVIDVKLFENFVHVNCLRVDPPSPPSKKATTTI